MLRVLILTLSVLTFGFVLAQVENPNVSIAYRNFSVLPVRYNKDWLPGCCLLTQAWMMWKLINFQLKKWKEHVKKQIPKKNIANTRNEHKRN